MPTTTRAGLTVTEVLIALVIASIVLASVAGTRMGLERLSHEARAETLALQVADDTLNTTRRLITSTPASFNTHAACPSTPNSAPCLTTFNSRGVTGTITTTPTGNTYTQAGLITITITVTHPHQLTLAGYASCLDLFPAPSVAEPTPCPTP